MRLGSDTCIRLGRCYGKTNSLMDHELDFQHPGHFESLAARTALVSCLIRMPNQDLSDVQAKNVLEFLRQNDGDK